MYILHFFYFYLGLTRECLKFLPLSVLAFIFGSGDLGLNASILSVQPVVILDDVKYFEYTSALKLLFVISGPNVSQPGLIVLSRPNMCNLQIYYFK